MSEALLNLSERPFVNLRPVVRVSVLLWAVGLLLLGGNLWLYWDFIAGRGDVDARRREAGAAIAVEERRIEALSAELASYDLATQNDQVRYLNQRIEQRRFSWSRLFDELAGLLPRDVRLVSLAPTSGEERPGRTRSPERRRASAVSDGEILLVIEGRARSDQAILELVDALFADPDFERPNLRDQATEPGGLVRFNLEVHYRPSAAEEPELLPVGPAEEPGSGRPANRPEAGPEGARTPVPLGRPASASRELT